MIFTIFIITYSRRNIKHYLALTPKHILAENIITYYISID
jgi:hypothetical protein